MARITFGRREETGTVLVPARVRPIAHNWVVAGRLGSPILPHAFCAVRATWAYDRKKMVLGTVTVATLVNVPGGGVREFMEAMETMRARAISKHDHHVITVADVTRSPELKEALFRRFKGIILARTPSGDQDTWNGAFRECGRRILLSRLHAWFGEGRIASALPLTEGGDPNVWTIGRLRSALDAARLKQPIMAENDPAQDETVGDDAALALAQACWWAPDRRPSPYEPEPEFPRMATQ